MILRQAIAAIALAIAIIPAAWARQPAAETYNRANALFAKGDWAGALKLYDSISLENQDLEYNRGAAHLKLGSLGKATLHFKRAERLAPGDEDARANLRYIAGAKLDKENVREMGPAAAALEWVLSIGSVPAVTWLALGLYLATAASAGGLVLSRPGAGRKWMAALIILTAALLAAGALAWARIDRLEARPDAAIMAREAPVYQAPSTRGDPVFTLHEATIVRMGRVEGNYVFITLSSGHSGWMDRAHLERI